MGVRLCSLAKMLFLVIERLRIGEGREFKPEEEQYEKSIVLVFVKELKYNG